LIDWEAWLSFGHVQAPTPLWLAGRFEECRGHLGEAWPGADLGLPESSDGANNGCRVGGVIAGGEVASLRTGRSRSLAGCPGQRHSRPRIGERSGVVWSETRCTSTDHASSTLGDISDRRHLDHEATFGHEDHERGVIEVTWSAPMSQRRDPLDSLPLTRTTWAPAPKGIQ
jgi:hypothetical protein